MGLPDETIFKGYSIHLENNDEYLVSYKIDSGEKSLAWSKFPEIAKCFQSLNKAENTKAKIRPEATIMWLFDTGTNIVATQPKDYN